MASQFGLFGGEGAPRNHKRKTGRRNTKRQRDKRRAERIKADPERLARQRAVRKRLKAKYRRRAGAMPIAEIRARAENAAKKRAISRLIYTLRLIAAAHPDAAELRRRRVAEKMRERYRTEPRLAVYQRLKRWMQKHLRKPGKHSRNWSRRLGYTAAELRDHLEAQFLPGMTWRNMGEWHIHHIRPVASFDFSSPDDAEFRECYALENLRPLWARDNLRLGARYGGVDYRRRARCS